MPSLFVVSRTNMGEVHSSVLSWSFSYSSSYGDRLLSLDFIIYRFPSPVWDNSSLSDQA
jgi:hypothetical protein